MGLRHCLKLRGQRKRKGYRSRDLGLSFKDHRLCRCPARGRESTHHQKGPCSRKSEGLFAFIYSQHLFSQGGLCRLSSPVTPRCSSGLVVPRLGHGQRAPRRALAGPSYAQIIRAGPHGLANPCAFQPGTPPRSDTDGVIAILS